MKKSITVLAVSLVLILLLVSCGNSVKGTYNNINRDATNSQKIILDNGECTWEEGGVAFSGTYEIDKENITITMSGGEVALDKVFAGTIDGNQITLIGGNLDEAGEIFEKE